MAVTTTRLSRADRHTQLLDAAADLVLTGGTSSLTMERLAVRAGVSKALVYLHFDNAVAVLADVYLREVTRLGREVLAAVGPAGAPETRLRAGVHAYFDVVEERGALFSVLAVAGSTAARDEEESRLGHRFVADLFREIFHLEARRSQVAAALFLGALNSGVEAWAAGDLRRREVEEAAVSVALHLATRRWPPLSGRRSIVSSTSR